MLRFLLLVAALMPLSHAFSPSSSIDISTRAVGSSRIVFQPLKMADTETETSESKKLSLEEKMASWEASEEEVKAATLGGVVPGSSGGESRVDGFDVGLYIAFPIMVISCLAFVFFPFLIGNIDIDSVGPPPTV